MSKKAYIQADETQIQKLTDRIDETHGTTMVETDDLPVIEYFFDL